jgi:hypoxanthine-guanine phosphoribosyltransferase
MLEIIEKNHECAIYRINEDKSSNLNRYIISTPQTRSICNDPTVFGVDYTRRLQKACTNVLKGMAQHNLIDFMEHEAIVFNILRGGLNFALREAIADAFNWNCHGSSFISAQRARQSENSEDWHIIESDYRKVYVPKTAGIIIGDVVATGTSLEHAVKALVREVQQQDAEIKSILFFTIGGPRTEEILEETDRVCRRKFPSYKGASLCYIEGRFSVPTPETPLSVKITGTDLLRRNALMPDEFIQSQYEDPAHPLQRCTIYDAGSRAFWTPEYFEDVIDYWQQNLRLAEKGTTFTELLQERCTGIDETRFEGIQLKNICLEQLEKLYALCPR